MEGWTGKALLPNRFCAKQSDLILYVLCMRGGCVVTCGSHQTAIGPAAQSAGEDVSSSHGGCEFFKAKFRFYGFLRNRKWSVNSLHALFSPSRSWPAFPNPLVTVDFFTLLLTIAFNLKASSYCSGDHVHVGSNGTKGFWDAAGHACFVLLNHDWSV